MVNPGILRASVVLAVSFNVFLNSAFAQTAPVGATPGEFAVNQNGGATYTIPIVIPPGTAGMAPKLSLTYDKQVQNDLVGVGWNVSGLSIIQRCGRTIALDGIKGGVNYDSNDRFCLDGQRLVAIKINPNDPDPIYGANNTEYRTEKESFSRIISYGTAGNGPQSFRVWTRNGQILEYGVTADSRVEAQGKTTVRLWALNKAQDRKGNYYTLSYFKDNANGEYRPTRIDYTGNASAGLTPYNSVQFVYGPRTDITPRYEGGSVIKATQRLANIKTCAEVTATQQCTDLGVSLVRDYRLTYDNNGAVGRSRLTSLTECGSDGICLPATVFKWQGGSDGTYTKTVSPAPGSDWSTTTLWPGDYNGDGKTDVLSYYNGTFVTFFANGDGTYTKTVSPAPGSDWSTTTLWPGDYNGDYSKDLLSYYNGNFITFTADTSFRDLLVSITHGLGARTTITYQYITNNVVYTKDNVT